MCGFQLKLKIFISSSSRLLYDQFISFSVKVTPGAVVCLEADYYGEITIGSRTVIHPKARILAEAGPIIIGEGNLVEEQAQIINR